MTVIPFLGRRRPSVAQGIPCDPCPERHAWHLARRDANRRFGTWLSTTPAPAEIEREIADTVLVLQQLRFLLCAPFPTPDATRPT